MITETWAIDGIPLLSLASHVARLDADAAPGWRGDDRTIALSDGQRWRAKMLDAATVTLGMMILGDDDSPAAASARAGAERQLINLLRPASRAQISLAHTWTDDLGTYTATALGEAQVPNRKRYGNGRVGLTCDIKIAAGVFLGDPVSTVLAVGVPATITVPGDANTTAVTLACAGQLTNPKVTNASPAPQVWVKVGTAVAAGDSVTVDVAEATVIRTSDGANLIGALTHSGARAWFGLQKGANTVTLTADAGTGTVTLTHRPVYF